MQIKVASHSGFCFGVKRAITIAEKALKEPEHKNGNIYSLGPIIHNPQVVDALSKNGLKVLRDIDGIKKGTVIVSSHGAPIETIAKIKKRGLKLIDATCPFVKYAHDIVRDLKAKGYQIIIVGDKKHPEVKTLLSLAGKRVNSKKIGIISQTTQNKSNYVSRIIEVLNKDFNEVRIFNTICNDTSQRQELARRFLKECDLMVVVGGRNSANTKRLYQICRENGTDSYHIESEAELKRHYFTGKKRVGVVSGASTPDKTVEKVAKKIRDLSA